jgi:hypothetical protein
MKVMLLLVVNEKGDLLPILVRMRGIVTLMKELQIRDVEVTHLHLFQPHQNTEVVQDYLF